MSQSIENLSVIRGTVLVRDHHPTLEAYDVLRVRLEAAEAVPGKANLLAPLVGSVVDVAVRRELLAGPDAVAGNRIRCRAKRTLDGAMCEPRPEPGAFEINPPRAEGPTCDSPG